MVVVYQIIYVLICMLNLCDLIAWQDDEYDYESLVIAEPAFNVKSDNDFTGFLKDSSKIRWKCRKFAD